MIKDFQKLLPEEDLYCFRKKGKLYVEYYENTDTACFMNEKYFKNGEYSLSRSFDDLCNSLKQIGAIKNLPREVGLKNNIITGTGNDYFHIAIEGINFHKINLLYDILHSNPNQANISKLNIITTIVNNEAHININSIIIALGIKKFEYIFNDVEILIHAINLKLPEKIHKLIQYLSDVVVEQKSIDLLSKLGANNSSVNNQNIKNILIKKGGLFNGKQPIMKLTGTEYKILKILRSSEIEEISLSNINKLTKQVSEDATKKMIEKINRDIAKNNLSHLIKINHSRGDNIYNLYLKSS